jgi:tetratricopeptide (TPR) repeat protein
MPLRFGKTIRFGKHVRLNISKSGASLSGGAAGLTYSQRLAGSASSSKRGSSVQRVTAQPTRVAIPKPPAPGIFASGAEKAFYRAVQYLQEGKRADALREFQTTATKDAGAAIFAAILSTDQPDQAIALLEGVLANDSDFPTPLMQKYLSGATIKINITNEVSANVPIDGLGAALSLAELYQSQNRFDEAIGILEELDELVDNPVLTLSLCDLYAAANLWQGVVAAAERIVIVDDITLETAILRGRAMFEQQLYDAAIAVFTEALKKKKDRDPDLLNEAVYWRGRAYGEMGKKSQAVKEFQKIYAENPQFRDVAERLTG